MTQYTFPSPGKSIFELNTQPKIAYLQHHICEHTVLPQGLHTHQEIAEIIFIEKGKSKCMIENHSYSVQEGDLLLLSAGNLHSTNLNNDVALQSYLIGIKNLHLKGFPRGALVQKNRCPVLPSNHLSPCIQQLFALLELFANQTDRENIAEAAQHTMQALLALVYELIQNNTETLPGQNYSLGLRIKEYIDEHYLEDIKLAAIAKALHINSYYLSHTFKKMLGYAPMQYIIQRRLGEAQNLLLTTDLTITEIALRCGYNNSNYFQVIFNKTVGMPPGKYRKSWRS
jgi:AraC-like DNA-binding protein